MKYQTMSTIVLCALLTLSVPLIALSPRLSVVNQSAFGVEDANPDFNGDGYADLAIGLPEEDVGDVSDAGAVQVIYGSASGLQASSPDDQFWSQNSPGVEDVAEASDSFGKSLATGDFNGDGKDDLAIAVNEQIIDSELTGAVNVLYGSSSGLQTSSPADQFWTQDSPGVEDSVELGDALGQVAAGDFNDDGYDDLAMGMWGEAVDNQSAAGAVNVLYGSPSGLQTSSPADQFWNQNSPGVEDEVGPGTELFGFRLAAADFNGDGSDDLAIGVPGEQINEQGSAGVVHILYGSAASGLQTSSPPDQFWTQDSPGVNDQKDQGEADIFGERIATGDFNGDGFYDLVASVPGESLGSIREAGAVNVLYGSSSGLRTSAAGDGTGRTDQFWHQNSPGVDDTAEQSDIFGVAITPGNFNGDEFDDLAIGVPGEDIGTKRDAGAVNILYGSSSGLTTSSPADQFWHQNVPGVEDTNEINDFFGSSLATGDFNGDNFDDLAVGVRAEGINSVVDAGAVNVLYGSSSGLQTSSPSDQFWTQNTSGVKDTAEANDNFGESLPGSPWRFA